MPTEKQLSPDDLIALVQSLPVAAICLDEERLFLNRRAEEFTGYRHDEIVTLDDWCRLLHGDHAPLAKAQYLAESTAAAPCEVVITCKDGTKKHVEWTADGKGQRVYVLHDVTGRVAAVRELQQREQQLRRDLAAHKVAEETRRDNEWLLLEAQKVGSLGTYIYDIRHDVWTSSGVLDAIFGIEADYPRDLAGWLAIIHPDSRVMMRDYFAHLIVARGRFDREYQIIRQNDGEVRWLCGYGEISYDVAGEPLRMIGTIQDITERKQSEEIIRVREETIRLLLDSTAEGIYGLDLNGCCTFCNEACLRLLGYSGADQFIGQKTHDLIHHSHADGHVYHEDECPIYLAFKDGTRIHVDNEVLWRADGSQFQAEYWSHPISKDGSVIGAVVTFVDISARRAAEKLIIEQTTWLAQVIAGCAVPLFVLDAQHRVTHWNHACAQLTGVPAAELIGTTNHWQPFYDTQRPLLADLLLLGVSPEQIRRYYGEAGHSSSTVAGAFEVEYFLPKLGKDGLWLLFTAALIYDAAGTVVGAIETLSDITEQKQAAEDVRRLNDALEHRVAERTAELRSALRHMESFAYSISHDLRTPLRAMAGHSQILLEDYGSLLPAKAHAALDRISMNAVHMGHLVDDLLMFSSIHRHPIHKTLVDCRSLLTTLTAEFKREYPESEVELLVGDLPPCNAEQTLLRHVFYNLLDNAFKFSRDRKPARIEIGTVSQEGRTIYFVRDNGLGFDMAHADKLFGMFQRLHCTENLHGTGVGLAIVENIIHRHGGRVWAEGEPGKGATFYFTLPA